MKHTLTAVDHEGVRRAYTVEAPDRGTAERALIDAGLVIVSEYATTDSLTPTLSPWLLALPLVAVPTMVVWGANGARANGQWLAELIGYSLPGALILALPVALIAKGLRRWGYKPQTGLMLLGTLMLEITVVGLVGEAGSMLVMFAAFGLALFLGILLVCFPKPD